MDQQQTGIIMIPPLEDRIVEAQDRPPFESN